MSEPTVSDVLLEVLERPYYAGQSFTTPELLVIAKAEQLFAKPLSAASVGLRLNHLVKVGKVIRLDAEHVIASRSI